MIQQQQILDVKSGKEANNLFPVFLKLNNFKILIIGGGEVALEKLNSVVFNSPEANITVVAESFIEEIRILTENRNQIQLIQSTFLEHHLDGQQLVISAINNIKKANEIKQLADKKGLFFNAADKPELCDFYLGSVVKKGNLKIAISTNGKSPTLAKRIKEILNQNIPDEIDESLDKLSQLRNHLNGDFKYKVSELNKATELLVNNRTKSWYEFSLKKFFAYILGVFSIMLAGHLLFTLIPLEVMWSSSQNLVAELDINFVYFMLGGFIAQMIDGALGMAYGVSATTFLLSFGVSPAVASMSVHTSEIFTSGVSGFMHLRFGNVNTKLFRNIVIPGVIGAIIGSYILSEFENYNAYIKPIVACYTLTLGIIIITKALRKRIKRRKVKHVGWLASAGGFLDSIGGGGWGPVVSSTLISRGKTPRYIIGSVNLAEFFVSLASSVTFFAMIGLSNWQPIVGLILGGVCAAPIAAYTAKKLNVKAMMLLVGIVVIIASLRLIYTSF